jgi:hypothetical protein
MDADVWLAASIMAVTGGLMAWWRWRDVRRIRQERRLRRLVDEARRRELMKWKRDQIRPREGTR